MKNLPKPQKDLPLPEKDLPLPEKDLPAGRQGLPLPEKEIPAEVKSLTPKSPARSKWLIISIAALFLFLISSVSAYLLLQNNAGKQVVCTQEAKLCPDGSYVGRTGPKCEFSACPTQ